MEQPATFFVQFKNCPQMLSEQFSWLTLLEHFCCQNSPINTHSKKEVWLLTFLHTFIKLEWQCKSMPELRRQESTQSPDIWQLNLDLRKLEWLVFVPDQFKALKGSKDWVEVIQQLIINLLFHCKDLGKEKTLQSLQYF